MGANIGQLDRIQQRQYARFERMGLACRPLPDGRSLLVALPLAGGPFESLGGAFSPDRILFATVGNDQIKCLQPRPVFSLPLLDIRRCADAAAIEATIRQAWRDRTRELRDTARTLQGLGVEVGVVEGGSALAFPISGESTQHPVLMHRLDEAILPTLGALSGHALHGLAERVVDVSGRLESAAELDLCLGSRIQELGQTVTRRAKPALITPPPVPSREASIRAFADQVSSRPSPSAREPKVLLVGSQILEHEELREELKRQGYRLATARSEPEALMRLASMTPDLVISQYTLGRSDGATFVQAVRALPGIVRIPVVLLDDAHQASRQEAARAVGAAGYVIFPLETNRFVTKLRKIAVSPGDRRFVRYSGRLSAKLVGLSRPCLATEIGRGGVFVATPDFAVAPREARFQIKVPELRRDLSFLGEILYRSDAQGLDRQGIGVRIREISAEDEAALIAYVTLRARED